MVPSRLDAEWYPAAARRDLIHIKSRSTLATIGSVPCGAVLMG
ncbi:MAG TPA: hypothetical protein VFC19_17705 [Candidatus Limnocylindrales bacterium]|nr:hypothetical protein [Candidatus Limnocylindrales bacterium]